MKVTTATAVIFLNIVKKRGCVVANNKEKDNKKELINMRGLCFSNKGIYKFETTPEKVKLEELNNNTVEELSISEYDYKLYSGEIIRVTKEIKEYIKDEKILRMIDMYA